MRILRKQTLRNLRKEWFQYFAVFVLIAVGLALIISVSDASDSISYALNDLEKETNVEDGNFSLFVPLNVSLPSYRVVAKTVQIFLYAYLLRFIRIHVGFCLSGYCFFLFSPAPFACYGLHPLYFTLLYICTLTKVKRFPGCHAHAVFLVRWCECLFYFRPYLSIYYGLYPLYFTSVYI